MTRFPADLFKILPNLGAVKILKGSEANAVWYASFLTLGCYLFPACAGVFLLVRLSWTPPLPPASDGSTETRTMFLERRATLLEHVFTLAACWEMTAACGFVLVCGVRLTSEVRAHTHHPCCCGNRRRLRSNQPDFLLRLLLSGLNVYL